MARIRTIKPEIWADEKLGPLEPIHRLVFFGLVSQADDAGRLLDSPRLLNGLLFPYTDHDCTESLAVLHQLRVIDRGATASGQRVIQLTGWQKHQKIEKPNLRGALPPIVGEESGKGRGKPLEPVVPEGFPETSGKGRGNVGDESQNHTYDQRPTSTTNDLKSPPSPPNVGGAVSRSIQQPDSEPRMGDLRETLIRVCLVGKESRGGIGIGLLVNQAKDILARGYCLEELQGAVSVIRTVAAKQDRPLGPLEPCSLAILTHRDGAEDWSFYQACVHEWRTNTPSSWTLPEVTQLAQRMTFPPSGSAA